MLNNNTNSTNILENPNKELTTFILLLFIVLVLIFLFCKQEYDNYYLTKENINV